MVEKRRAIFLDRDGVINKKRDDYVKSINELEIFPFVASAIKKLNNANFKVIVITNQSAINRNIITHKKVEQIHLTIQNYLKKNQSFIDAFYYCPHRPDENCICRKPKPGLLIKAIQDFKINPKESWMIGDSNSDLESGRLVGCNVMKINNHVNLEKAVELIIESN
jgi:histidinol-phosphate phosphatase family protein|tara:strand:+ start:1323 stop:1820 length:498 start_codon:yes stop_codon:yes gene_type:complete